MKKYTVWIFCICAVLFLTLFSFQKMDLATADIGRHLENGKIFLHPAEFGTTRTALLHTNFFSYTQPDFPFMNHHWGSGVLLYLFYSLFGFGGLSLLYFSWIAIGLVCVILAVFDEVDLPTLALTSIFLIPMIADRTEVRPEGLSFLFLALFFCILYRYSRDKLPKQFLYALPFIQLLWVNMHIYFIFGIYLVGVFFFEALILKHWHKARKLAQTLSLTILANLINPYGWNAIIYPFLIFRNYGYRVVENQSIAFLEHLSFLNPTFLWYKITLGLLVLSSIYILVRLRKEFLIAPSILTFTFAVLGYTGIRNIALFGLFSLPLLAYNIYTIKKSYVRDIPSDMSMIIYGLTLAVVIVSTLVHFSLRLPMHRDFGLGIAQGELDSVHFIQTHAIHGPIFNNYDIGGMMIFALYPTEKVFVDNRPEAYSASFFSDIYIPMQEDDAVWQRELDKEGFNVIYFYRLDYTPWAQSFLIRRVCDPAWAPVYVDARTIIFLRRVATNQQLISQFELPKEMFGNACVKA